MPQMEYITELTGSKGQNVEWFSSDLTVQNRPKMLCMNIATQENVAIEMTLDSGSTWFDLDASKKHDFADLIRFVLSPDETLNMRTPTAGGVTIDHLHIYAEVS